METFKVESYWNESDNPDFKAIQGLRNIIALHALENEVSPEAKKLLRRIFGGYGTITVTKKFLGTTGGASDPDSLRGFGSTSQGWCYEFEESGEVVGRIFYSDNPGSITAIEVVTDNSEKPLSLLNKLTWSGAIEPGNERHVLRV